MSSLQNFVILFAALHYLSVSGIGYFTLAYTAALFIESLLKSLLLEPLTIRFAARDRRGQRRACGHAAGASVVVGSIVAAAVATASLAFGDSLQTLVLATGLMIPCLISQEVWRVYFFMIARPWHAAVNDGLCLAGTAVLVVYFAIRHHEATPALLLVLWAGGTGIGAFVGLAQTRIVPVIGQTWHWTSEHWTLGSRLAGGYGAEQLAGRASLAIIGGMSGVAALGRLSAARTVLAPAATVVTSAISFAVPEAVRMRQRGDLRLPLFILGVSASLTACASLFGVGMYVLPDQAGELIAGRNWDTAKSLLLPVVAWTAAVAIRHGPRVGLRAFDRPDSIIRLSMATGVGVVVASAIGSWVGGAPGAAWALVVVHLAMSVIWWIVYLRAVRDERTAHHGARVGR